MRKIVSLLLVVMLTMGAMAGMVSAEEVDECPAAPDVAGQILELFDVGFRYEAGTVEHRNGTLKTVYENYISMVAHQMTSGAAFPAYNWYGQWDGETYVEKCDVDAYYQAVYNYLVGLKAPIPKALTVELLEDIADGFIYQPFKTVSGGFPTVKVTDIHGNPVEGLGMRVSLPSIAEISGIVLTDSNGLAVFNNLSYGIAGNYRANFYIADSTIRSWSSYSRALSNWFDLYSMVGTWYWRADRFIVIDSHTSEEFSGKLQDQFEEVLGNITGTINGMAVTMNYDRIGYSGDGYKFNFTGEAEDYDTITGTYVHGNNIDFPRPGTPSLTMIRQ